MILISIDKNIKITYNFRNLVIEHLYTVQDINLYANNSSVVEYIYIINKNVAPCFKYFCNIRYQYLKVTVF